MISHGQMPPHHWHTEPRHPFGPHPAEPPTFETDRVTHHVMGITHHDGVRADPLAYETDREQLENQWDNARDRAMAILTEGMTEQEANNAHMDINILGQAEEMAESDIGMGGPEGEHLLYGPRRGAQGSAPPAVTSTADLHQGPNRLHTTGPRHHSADGRGVRQRTDP